MNYPLRTTNNIIRYFKTNQKLQKRLVECYILLLGNNNLTYENHMWEVDGNNNLTYENHIWEFDDINQKVICKHTNIKDLWIKEIPYSMLDDDGLHFWKEGKILEEI